MDWLKRMNCALDYVENNLTSEIDMNIVAQRACCSSYNFQKMFSFITGISLVEYIKFIYFIAFSNLRTRFLYANFFTKINL